VMLSRLCDLPMGTDCSGFVFWKTLLMAAVALYPAGLSAPRRSEGNLERARDV
jgi:hypothetical protein